MSGGDGITLVMWILFGGVFLIRGIYSNIKNFIVSVKDKKKFYEGISETTYDSSIGRDTQQIPSYITIIHILFGILLLLGILQFFRHGHWTTIVIFIVGGFIGLYHILNELPLVINSHYNKWFRYGLCLLIIPILILYCDSEILSYNIKGNISFDTKEKIYHTKNCPYYESTIIDKDFGEKWFRTEKQAIQAGWRKAKDCPEIEEENNEYYDDSYEQDARDCGRFGC